MYTIFQLPKDFLDRPYTKDETAAFDEAIDEHITDGVRLNEALDDEQKENVDKWRVSSLAKQKHDSVFGEGKERIRIPIPKDDTPITKYNLHDKVIGKGVSHTSSLIDLLHGNGFHVDDYVAGIMHHSDTPNRKIKIGKWFAQNPEVGDRKTRFMSNTKYETDERGKFIKKDGQKVIKSPGKYLTNAEYFAADPIRQSSKHEAHIVITRNKYDVAGMSTDRGWSSCMDMVDGENKYYLKHDIANGTMTAYVCHKDDHDISRPIGRINLKQFTSVGDNLHHSIYRPEQSSYGAIPSVTRKLVTDWAEKNYPSKEGIYMKAPELYSDDGESIKAEKPLKFEDAKHVNDVAYSVAKSVRDSTQLHTNVDFDDEPLYDKVHAAIEKVHSSLDPKTSFSALMHSVAAHSTEHDGEYQYDGSMIDMPTFDTHPDEFVQQHAIDKIHSMTGTQIKHALHTFSPEETKNSISMIHSAMKGDEDGHEALQKIHDGLISHAFEHHPDDHDLHSLIIHHAVDSDNAKYYENMDTSHFKRHHLVQLTKDPRLMHHIISSESGLEDTIDGHSGPLEHIGKYADTKLAHEVMHSTNFDEYHTMNFINGTNFNPNGEHIQHSLTDDMLLVGGKAHNEPLKGVHTKGELSQAMKGYHTGYQGPDADHTDADQDHIARFAEIASRTHFKSVYDKIKARSLGGDLDHPDIHAALSDNNLRFHIKESRIISFKDFMKG